MSCCTPSEECFAFLLSLSQLHHAARCRDTPDGKEGAGDAPVQPPSLQPPQQLEVVAAPGMDPVPFEEVGRSLLDLSRQRIKFDMDRQSLYTKRSVR